MRTQNPVIFSVLIWMRDIIKELGESNQEKNLDGKEIIASKDRQ